MLFRDRSDAGRRLAVRLQGYANRPDVIVLALPRGGVPVGYEVARELGAPLDVFLVRKLGFPGQEELAMGAIASGGVRVLNTNLLRRFHLPDYTVEAIATRELAELERRERAYRGSTASPAVRGNVVILVDDGLATGSTMRAAAAALRRMDPARIVVAVPVGAESSCEEFGGIVDEVVCAETPEPFRAVGQWYDDFSQTTDDEVRALLQRSRAERAQAAKQRGRAPEHAASDRRKGAVHY